MSVVLDRVDATHLQSLADGLAAANACLYVDEYAAEELLVLSRVYASCLKLAQNGSMLVAAAIDRTAAHRRDGDRSAADRLANETGTSTGAAQSTINTGRRLRDRRATEDAVRGGRVSAAQAGIIGNAAAEDEAVLLDLATSGRGGFRRLREEAERLAAARQSEQDAMAQYRRVHAERHLRTWTKGGALCGSFSMNLDDGGQFLARLEAETERVYKHAYAEGRREPIDAYRLDALMNLVTGTGTARTVAAMRISVDAATIERGHLVPGERCEIDGLGPIPVTIARSLLLNAQVHGVAFDGVNVHDITKTTRTISTSVRRALEARDPCCAVPGCGQTKGLEIDHIIPFAQGGPTELDNLLRLCRTHHRLKTTLEWHITGPPGHRQWLPPLRS